MKFKKSKKLGQQVQSSERTEKMYLSIKECVDYTGLSEYAIRNLISKKAVPFLNAGRKVMIDRVALDEYLKKMSENHLSL